MCVYLFVNQPHNIQHNKTKDPVSENLQYGLYDKIKNLMCKGHIDLF
jgi:hypothetical protein